MKFNFFLFIFIEFFFIWYSILIAARSFSIKTTLHFYDLNSAPVKKYVL